MSNTKTIDDIGLKAHIIQHEGLVCCPYLPPLQHSEYVPLYTTSGEVITEPPIKFVTRYDVDVIVNVPISHLDITVTVSPSHPPVRPAVGDVWAEEDGDSIGFYVWDGFIWREVSVGDPYEPESQKVEADTPEKAYDRAMGVVR